MKTIISFLILMIIANLTFAQAKKAQVAKAKSEAKPSNCILSTFSSGPDNYKTFFQFTNNEKEITRSVFKFGQQTTVFIYAYDSINRLISITDSAKKKEMVYVYSDNNQLIEIKGNGSFLPRKFTYDEKGRIVTQNTVYNNGETQTLHEYSYNDNGLIIKISVSDAKKEKTFTFIPVFDSKKNPLRSTGININSTEALLGYPASLLNGNLIKLTTIYEKKTNYMVNGKYKNPGEQDSQTYTYKYNTSGYPIEISFKLPNGVISKQNFGYDCKPIK